MRTNNFWVVLLLALVLMPRVLADRSFAIISPLCLGQPLAGSELIQFSKEGELPTEVGFSLRDGKITGFNLVYHNATFNECFESLKKDWGEPDTVIAPGQMVVWRPKSFRGTINLIKGEKKSDGTRVTIQKFIVIKPE
jgi:hypothetical protein